MQQAIVSEAVSPEDKQVAAQFLKVLSTFEEFENARKDYFCFL